MILSESIEYIIIIHNHRIINRRRCGMISLRLVVVVFFMVFADVEIGSSELLLEEREEFEGRLGNKFEAFMNIPLRNQRTLMILNLFQLPSNSHVKAVQFYQQKMDEQLAQDEGKFNYKRFKSSPFPAVDKSTDWLWNSLRNPSNPKLKRDLKLKLLREGFWVECGWGTPLPPPLSQDTFCTLTELKYVIDNLD